MKIELEFCEAEFAMNCVWHFCAHAMFSVPAQWTMWTPWTSCSLTCGPGGTRERSRNPIPGRHPTTEPEGDPSQSQECSTSSIPGWPTCPKPATYGIWEDWPPCPKTCFNEGSFPPLIERKRKCLAATLSSNADLNNNIVTCATLPEIRDRKICRIPPCPGEM